LAALAGALALAPSSPAVDGEPGKGNSRGASVSADGRYVAFWSVATNLSPLDTGSRPWQRSVFMRDLKTGRTILASRRSAAAGGANAAGHSDDVALSGDGRYVAFRSDASNLGQAHGKRVTRVFLRDLRRDRTILVSRQSAADGGAAAFATSPSVSADGRYVAFESGARNLSRLATGRAPSVYLRDVKAKRTVLVSRQSAADGGAGANDWSAEPAVSGDGRYVAFISLAGNLSDADLNPRWDVFVRDMKTGTTELVSRQSAADGGAGGDGDSYRPALSSDGRYIAFKSDADNLSAADNDDVADVFVRDMETDTTVLVSRQSAADGGAGANGNSYYPALSADGRLVAFQSDADNLSTADQDGVSDVFVHDTATGTTELASRQTEADGGAGGDRGSYVPSLSARHVVFWSYARNLSATDIDGGALGTVADVFLRDLQTDTTLLVSRASGR
jgi:Tol biopolymer transport system component